MDAGLLIGETLGSGVESLEPLHGGCIGQVFRARLADGRDLAVKIGASGSDDGGFRLEAEMLGRLGAVAPTARVVHADGCLLAMEYVSHGGGKSAAGEAGLGEHVAAIHGVTGEWFGYAGETRLREIVLRNTAEDREREDWCAYYVNTRLRPMVEMSAARGLMSGWFVERAGELADRFGEVIGGASEPRLLHGDLWAGNVLWRDGHVAALIDPLSLFGDPEVELAFIALMGGVSDAFWDRYASLRGIRDGFWERRVFAYQVVPLLIHAVLFGGGYGDEAARCVDRALGG